MTETARFRQSGDGEECSSADLLRECGQRLADPALWRQFEKRFHRSVLTYVTRVMGNRFRSDSLDDARDLVQEVYLRLVEDNGRVLRSFKGDTEFSVKAFLARITVNVASEYYRSRNAEKRGTAEIISIDQARQQEMDLPEEAVKTNIASILSVIDIDRLLEAEPDKRNAARNVLIFKLHYVNGFTAREIAQFPAFGLEVSAVGSILRNLKLHLNRKMGL
jgi:RNA polymerase sigma factor (sigma-70 family)